MMHEPTHPPHQELPKLDEIIRLSIDSLPFQYAHQTNIDKRRLLEETGITPREKRAINIGRTINFNRAINRPIKLSMEELGEMAPDYVSPDGRIIDEESMRAFQETMTRETGLQYSQEEAILRMQMAADMNYTAEARRNLIIPLFQIEDINAAVMMANRQQLQEYLDQIKTTAKEETAERLDAAKVFTKDVLKSTVGILPRYEDADQSHPIIRRRAAERRRDRRG